MSKLRVGVVGVGALGRHHARIYSQLAGCELVGVADPSAERGRAAAEAAGCPWLADYRGLLETADAVSIAVPTFAHHAVASEFLNRGIAVLVEKPLASTLAQAAELVALALRAGATLQVGHVERFNPAAEAARRLTGPPKYIRAERTSPYAFRSTDIGVVLDVMIHDLDLVLDLVRSPLAEVSALGLTILGENEDCMQARLVFENGCVADLSANRVHPSTNRTMQIWSHRGCVAVDFAAREVVHYSPSERLRRGDSPLALSRQPGADVERLKSEMFGEFIRVERPEIPKIDALTAELASFADCVRNRRPPIVDGRAGLAAIQAADRILNAAAQHRWNGDAAGPVGPFLTLPPLRRAAA